MIPQHLDIATAKGVWEASHKDILELIELEFQFETHIDKETLLKWIAERRTDDELKSAICRQQKIIDNIPFEQNKLK